LELAVTWIYRTSFQISLRTLVPPLTAGTTPFSGKFPSLNLADFILEWGDCSCTEPREMEKSEFTGIQIRQQDNNFNREVGGYPVQKITGKTPASAADRSEIHLLGSSLDFSIIRFLLSFQ
jgi:hypothetical protein